MNGDMPKTPESHKPAAYAVGYGKPPLHTRFRKGVSGNPHGGSRAQMAARTKALALKEAFRPVTVREGDKVMRIPAVQAVLRSQVALAVKGNGPAQRAMIAAAQALEQERAIEAAEHAKAAAERQATNYIDAARRVTFLMTQAFEQMGVPRPEKLDDAIAVFFGCDQPKEGA